MTFGVVAAATDPKVVPQYIPSVVVNSSLATGIWRPPLAQFANVNYQWYWKSEYFHKYKDYANESK